MRRPAGVTGSRRVAELAAVAALWLGAALGLQALTTRVGDWFVMTDELLYERLAISIARGRSPLPRVHEVLVPSVDQLYPLLIAPLYGDQLVPASLHDAHFVNAFVMSSACIPAYLVARRATGRVAAAWITAVLSLCVPWLVLSSFLLTEVAAYPAFLWAVYGIQVALDSPSPRKDGLALLGIALAVLARTQFAVLLVVLAVAAVAVDGRMVLTRHRALAWAYAALAAAGLVLLATGRTASALGTYGSTIRGNLLPTDSGRAFTEHVAVVALGAGVLPFVVGLAWLLAKAVRRDAFAVLAVVTVVALAVEVTIFDLRFGGGTVRDRYLFYLVPLVLTGFAAAVVQRSWPLWSLALPAAVVAVGFGVARLPRYDKLNADTPVSIVDNVLVRSTQSLAGARIFLVAATLLAIACFLAWRPLRIAVLALTLAIVPAGAAYAWVRLYRAPGTSGRPLTHPAAARFAWLDHHVGLHRKLTLVPYPTIPGDYWASVGSWWDLEFWNVSAGRAAYYPGEFEETPSTFP